MNEDDIFEMACFHAAGLFLSEKADQGCTRSIFYFSRPEMAKSYEWWRIPTGHVMKVTVEYVPESEIQVQP